MAATPTATSPTAAAEASSIATSAHPRYRRFGPSLSAVARGIAAPDLPPPPHPTPGAVPKTVAFRPLPPLAAQASTSLDPPIAAPAPTAPTAALAASAADGEGGEYTAPARRPLPRPAAAPGSIRRVGAHRGRPTPAEPCAPETTTRSFDSSVPKGFFSQFSQHPPTRPPPQAADLNGFVPHGGFFEQPRDPLAPGDECLVMIAPTRARFVGIDPVSGERQFEIVQVEGTPLHCAPTEHGMQLRVPDALCRAGLVAICPPTQTSIFATGQTSTPYAGFRTPKALREFVEHPVSALQQTVVDDLTAACDVAVMLQHHGSVPHRVVPRIVLRSVVGPFILHVGATPQQMLGGATASLPGVSCRLTPNIRTLDIPNQGVWQDFVDAGGKMPELRRLAISARVSCALPRILEQSDLSSLVSFTIRTDVLFDNATVVKPASPAAALAGSPLNLAPLFEGLDSTAPSLHTLAVAGPLSAPLGGSLATALREHPSLCPELTHLDVAAPGDIIAALLEARPWRNVKVFALDVPQRRRVPSHPALEALSFRAAVADPAFFDVLGFTALRAPALRTVSIAVNAPNPLESCRGLTAPVRDLVVDVGDASSGKPCAPCVPGAKVTFRNADVSLVRGPPAAMDDEYVANGQRIVKAAEAAARTRLGVLPVEPIVANALAAGHALPPVLLAFGLYHATVPAVAQIVVDHDGTLSVVVGEEVTPCESWEAALSLWTSRRLPLPADVADGALETAALRQQRIVYFTGECRSDLIGASVDFGDLEWDTAAPTTAPQSGGSQCFAIYP